MFSLWSISAGAKSAGRRRLESDEFILRRNELIGRDATCPVVLHADDTPVRCWPLEPASGRLQQD